MSGWEHHRQETGIPINMRSIAQNGNGRAIGVTPVYPRGENIRPNYNLPQGVLPSQGVQRAVSGPSVYGSAPNRFPAYFTAPGVEMRPHYPPCFPSRGTYLIPGKQRGQLHQRFSHSPTTRGNSDVSSNTHNTPTYGIVPPRPLRMQNNQYPCAPAGQLYLHEQVVAPIPSVQPALLANHDSLSTECVTKMGKLDVLHLQPVAVSAGENGFQPAGGVSISESDISFVISCRHRDKDVEEVTVVIIAMHIVKIAYIRGVGVKNYLALLLTDIGRLELYDLLQIRDHYRNWDLIFYVNFDPRLEKQVRDRLGEFYGSKVNDVDQCELKTMPDLSWNIVRVLRYAHFLDILAKESEESSKNNSVSQGPSSIQRCIETTGLTAEGDVDLNRDETQANAGDTPPATIYHTTQQAPSTSREESVSEDNNNNFPAGGISTRARIQSSSSWNAFGQFGNEEKPYIIRDGDTSSINHASSVKPFENYGTAGEFLASFSGLDDTNDFPVDFLEEEKNLEIPDKGDVKIQEELLTVEDGDNADVVMKSGESLKFVGGVSVGLDVARENLYDGALMNGDMASFFIVHYIPHALLPSNWSKRNKVYFANSDLYPMVSRKCRNSLLQGEEMTAEKVKELFLSRKGAIPSYLQKLMEAELSVIPIFWENHWMLGLLQMYAPTKGIISGRLVVMDSKFDDERNKHVLKKIAETAHHHLRVAINSGLLLLEKPYQLKNLTLVRCESLPCQDNGVDCGWFMALYAERFVRDMSWMEMSDDEVRFLQLEDDETQAFYERIRNIRREVGTYMEKYTQRCLNFDYDKRAETPPHKALLFKS